MKIQPINPQLKPGHYVFCVSCAKRLVGGVSAAWADLDARPGTFYCDDCAQKVKAEAVSARDGGPAMNDPLKPAPALLCKLGSIARHAQELTSPGGHEFDRIAMDELLKDPSVAEWLAGMDAMALLPVMRKQP